MSELVDKLHYKLDGTTDEITLYSTLGEVNNKGLNVKVNGINAYAGYGTEADGEVSRMNYKPPTEVAQKVLKQAGEPVLLNLLGYRNNEDLLQALPVTQVTKGSYVHFNNENAPTISGYDFVCAVPNCFIAEEATTVKIYYIPQSVPDRTKTDWRNYYNDDDSIQGDLFSSDLVNTYSATDMQNMFYSCDISVPPKLNMSNVTNANSMFANTKISNFNGQFYDLSNITSAYRMFTGLTGTLITADISGMQNVEDMQMMFSNCWVLESIILPRKMTKVNAFSTFCAQAYKLKKIDFTGTELGKECTLADIGFQYAFQNCQALESINLNSVHTEKINNFQRCFYNCKTLKEVIGEIDLSNAVSIRDMFSNTALTTPVKLKNVPSSLDLSQLGTDMYQVLNYI